MTVRLTVAQALVRFLANQYSERDGVRQRLIPGCFGIFGHGNVAGVGQALLQASQTGDADLKYYLARNEQAMVHASVGFARMRNRLQVMACTASIGPGSTNMVTGAALATINRIPVLLLPSDFFATRAAWIPDSQYRHREMITFATIASSHESNQASLIFKRLIIPEHRNSRPWLLASFSISLPNRCRCVTLTAFSGILNT